MFHSLFSENHAVFEILWKIYSRDGEATVDNMAHFTLGT